MTYIILLGALALIFSGMPQMPKLERISVVVALVIIALMSAASAQTMPKAGQIKVIPPVQYDHPYTGTLTVTVMPTDQLEELCAKYSTAQTIRPMLACSFRYATSCNVYIASPQVIAGAGFTTEIVRRHEIGHCNGWPANHEGAR